MIPKTVTARSVRDGADLIPMRVAAIQMNSGADVAENLQAAAILMRESAADLIVLPENFACMGSTAQKHAIAESFGSGMIQDWLAEQSRNLGAWCIAGSVPIISSKPDSGGGRLDPACLLYSPAGRCAARYDKLHLFDVDLGETGESYRESETWRAGDEPVVAPCADVQLGLSICYDLRFPELYRQLVEAGANVLTVPSAFTYATGSAHWEALLRVRAIENQSYVIGAGQCGQHPENRQTWGRSMIVDPWGRVLDFVEHEPGYAVADLDMEALRRLRRDFPVLEHRRL